MTEWTPRQLEILDHTRTLRLATISPRGDPFNAPVRFYFDGASLYITSPAESEQIAHLHANRRLAVLADLSEDGALQGFVVQGLAQWVHSDREAQGVWEAMTAKYPARPPEEVRGALVKIDAVRVRDLD
ncbi:MAG: pyridoxamine 5'-phosphate oxidase family protein [Thermoplasmata archaeon]